MSDLAELATADGVRPPADLPRGQFFASIAGDEIRIDRADPRVLISAELLGLILAGRAAPCCSLGGGAPNLIGAVLRIEAANRTVIYRITRYEASVRGYVGEWPD